MIHKKLFHSRRARAQASMYLKHGKKLLSTSQDLNPRNLACCSTIPVVEPQSVPDGTTSRYNTPNLIELKNPRNHACCSTIRCLEPQSVPNGSTFRYKRHRHELCCKQHKWLCTSTSIYGHNSRSYHLVTVTENHLH